MRQRRVVVTGLGMISPLGLDVASTWEGILAGRSGITDIDTFDVSGYPTRFGGPIRNFDVTRYMSAKEAKRFDPFVHYGVAAAVQATLDSGYELDDEVNDRVGVAVGSGIGGDAHGTCPSSGHYNDLVTARATSSASPPVGRLVTGPGTLPSPPVGPCCRVHPTRHGDVPPAVVL